LSTELIIAITASITSLVVAIISLIASIISNRQTSHSGQQIEILKHKLVQQQTKEQIADMQLNENIKSLQKSIQAIQHVKDVIQVILSAVKSSLDSESAIAEITASREALFSCYEENLANLDESEEKVFHRVKNFSLDVEHVIVHGLHNKQSASNLSKQDKQRLSDLRNLLTDGQQLLRDSLTNRISKRIGYEKK
jgi:hypothetical protein